MKKTIILILSVILLFTLASCKKEVNEPVTENIKISTTAQKAAESETEDEQMKIAVKVNGAEFTATLEDNEAAKELYEMVKSGVVSVKMSDYSGFEKVGSLGKTLTANDKRITAKRGDIVLYNSSQIVMFYGSNTWSYTRLGRIDNLDGWEDALGKTDITAEFTAIK